MRMYLVVLLQTTSVDHDWQRAADDHNGLEEFEGLWI